jgi:hypothetical protein
VVSVVNPMAKWRRRNARVDEHNNKDQQSNQRSQRNLVDVVSIIATNQSRSSKLWRRPDLGCSSSSSLDSHDDSNSYNHEQCAVSWWCEWPRNGSTLSSFAATEQLVTAVVQSQQREKLQPILLFICIAALQEQEQQQRQQHCPIQQQEWWSNLARFAWCATGPSSTAAKSIAKLSFRTTTMFQYR